MFISIDQAHSLSLHHRKFNENNDMEPYLIDAASYSTDDDESVQKTVPEQLNPISNTRRSDSAEKYFDWASKTNRKFIHPKSISTFFLFSLFFRSYGILARQTFLALHEKR